MSGAAEANSSTKRSILDANEGPPVKKAAVEPVPSPEVAELQQLLRQSDNKLRHMCKMENKAREMVEELRERVMFLENIIDTKEDILKNANKVPVEDELKKKVSDLTDELEESQLRAAQQRAEDSAKVDELTSLLREERQTSTGLNEKLANLADLEKKVSDLTDELEESQLRAAQQRAEDSDKVDELTAQLKVEMQKSVDVGKKLARFVELEKKVKVLECDLKEANKQTAEQRSKASAQKKERIRTREECDEYSAKLGELTNQLDKEMHKSAHLREKLAHFTGLEKKVGELTSQLEDEKLKSAGLHGKLAHFAELEKKVKVLECDLKEANKQASEQRSSYEMRIDQLARSMEAVRSIAVRTVDELKQERKLSAELKQKLVQVGEQWKSVAIDCEQRHQAIAASLASIDVPTSSFNLVSTAPPIPPRTSITAPAHQKITDEQSPTDADVKAKIAELVKGFDLAQVSMEQIVQAVCQAFPGQTSLSDRTSSIKEWIRDAIEEWIRDAGDF